MRWLMIGTGLAHEHASYLSMLQSLGLSDEIRFVLIGGNGLLEQSAGVVCVHNLKQATDYAVSFAPDIVVILNPFLLAEGAVDYLRSQGLNTFGVPSASAALEGSKCAGREFARAQSIAAPLSHVFNSYDDASNFLTSNWCDGEQEYVVKADGLDVRSIDTTVPASLEEAAATLGRIWPHGRHQQGPPAQVLIEEKLYGPELSLHVVFDGKDYSILPPVCDYKTLFENDQGPCTGGIGSIATTSICIDDLLADISRTIVEPTLEGIASHKLDYRFILYFGLMVCEDGAKLIEYNTRPGNPEWLALLQLLESPLDELILAVQNVELGSHKIAWHKDMWAASLVATSGFYPYGKRDFNEPVVGLSNIDDAVQICGENIQYRDETLYAESGRVVVLSAKDKDRSVLRNILYKNMEYFHFNGMYYRRDIGIDRSLLGAS